ncbi:hypothetical protein BHE74_00028162 [Ensete ventricosum]|nr:hypothetical protein BHE74_00028162 [Ensete ventricosum]
MRLGTYLECIGSSSRVSGVCQDGTREFVKKRPRLAGRLSGVAKRLVKSWECLDDAVGARRKFARTSPKVSGRSLEEDHETRPRECRRMSDCWSEVIKFGGHAWL